MTRRTRTAALVEADVLGIFGKYGVRLAAYWTTPVNGQGAPLPAWHAFRLYRNYDGRAGVLAVCRWVRRRR